ncbi:MAG: ferredoxin-NADP reductase, partial [Gammaproteobacteria bacterium]|nr:ferredoxin-NADP reductase [Gammaproteobacteria bacterium]
MRLDDFPTEPRYAATVLKTERITEEGADVEVCELVLEVDRHEFNFDVGQSIGVLVEGPEEFGDSLHHRLYTVADTPGAKGKGKPRVTIVVRRCDYVDDYSGEKYAGVNSNYLCDRKPGDKVYITGPFGLPFEVPEDKSANLILIGLGTGIAPFRAFVKHIYEEVGDWAGKV